MSRVSPERGLARPAVVSSPVIGRLSPRAAARALRYRGIRTASPVAATCPLYAAVRERYLDAHLGFHPEGLSPRLLTTAWTPVKPTPVSECRLLADVARARRQPNRRSRERFPSYSRGCRSSLGDGSQHVPHERRRDSVRSKLTHAANHGRFDGRHGRPGDARGQLIDSVG